MGSITVLINRFSAGSRSALAVLDRRYAGRQRRVAARLLGPAYPGLSGPDDVVSQVFHRLAREADTGTPVATRLSDTQSLLAALDLLTAQRVRKAWEYDHRGRRDIRRTVRDADRPDDAVVDWPAADPLPPIDWPPGLSERQREVGRLVAEGWGQGEIARQLRVSVRTVARETQALRAAFAARAGG